MKTLTGINSITVDSPGAGQVTVVFAYADQSFASAMAAQRFTVGELPANPNWSRAQQLTDLALFIKRNGANTVAMLPATLSRLAISLEPGLSWPPLIATQPVAVTCTGNASAIQTLTNDGTNVSNGDTVTAGTKVYTFQTVLTNVDGNVKIGASNTASMTNLFHAINASGGTPGTDYATAMTANTQFTATNPTGTTVVVTAIASGLAGNAIATTETSSHLSWGAATATGGTDHSASFTVVAGVTETTLSYQWQYSTDGGSTWANATGTINGCVYTNGTTATLTCAPTTVGQNGLLHKCVVTNLSGSTSTNGLSLVIA